jgi:SPP1 family predicted phage head-tail adaptor
VRLDRRVQFQRAALVDNGLEQVETFSNHGTPIWAERKDVSDGEKARAGSVEASLMSRFVVRYSAFTAGITPKDRLTCEGQTFDITGIKTPQGTRRQWLEISGTARTDQ